ncbi:polysaccharide deacetylase family protein [Marinoscillum furvescens]|uniref:Polysaccharide deacetylase n=1 Tax=Marinoscillum furvescens DSM 4134 TaxID=1122208 RepID=A0A3D9LFZ1_MARFU|nr:polysaccharide deacetylase family protein [Marinoscillum furvescens]REE05517.1 polysaccharide deacetylase [Marinoscillum furvescens DSM 4134]
MSALLLWLFTFMIVPLASSNEPPTIYLSKYYGDKQCAISYTFDDGVLEHYTLVFPRLKELGFYATFWINGNSINVAEKHGSYNGIARISWKGLREMAEAGHEISNHGWSHKKLTECSPEEVQEEVHRNDREIAAQTGFWPTTYCFAGNSMNPELVQQVSKGRVGVRIRQYRMGRRSSAQVLEEKLTSLISKGEACVTMIHGITHGHDPFSSAAILWDHLEQVKALEDKIWVARFKDLAAYQKAYDNTQLQIVPMGEYAWKIIPICTLDAALFRVRLTMVIEGQTAENITISQGGKLLRPMPGNNKILVDIDPHGPPIRIVKTN